MDGFGRWTIKVCNAYCFNVISSVNSENLSKSEAIKVRLVKLRAEQSGNKQSGRKTIGVETSSNENAGSWFEFWEIWEVRQIRPYDRPISSCTKSSFFKVSFPAYWTVVSRFYLLLFPKIASKTLIWKLFDRWLCVKNDFYQKYSRKSAFEL